MTVPETDPTPCPLSFLLPPHSLWMEPPPYLYFFSPFTWVLPESTRLQPPQPTAGSHLSMYTKIMYIVLTILAPVFYCFNNTQGTDHDHFLTHIAAGLAMLCKSPVLDRKKKISKRITSYTCRHLHVSPPSLCTRTLTMLQWNWKLLLFSVLVSYHHLK